MPESNTPNFMGTLDELDAGLFIKKLETAVSSTAIAVVAQEGKAKKGQVVITLDFARLNENSSQIELSHTLKFSTPTATGKKGEESKTATLLYVGTKGKLSVAPEAQGDFFKQKQGA